MIEFAYYPYLMENRFYLTEYRFNRHWIKNEYEFAETLKVTVQDFIEYLKNYNAEYYSNGENNEIYFVNEQDAKNAVEFLNLALIARELIKQ